MRSIEDVAIDLFAERPMAEVTIEEIAFKAGTPSGRSTATSRPRRNSLRVPGTGSGRDRRALRARPATETPVEALRAAIGDTMDASTAASSTAGSPRC